MYFNLSFKTSYCHNFKYIDHIYTNILPCISILYIFLFFSLIMYSSGSNYNCLCGYSYSMGNLIRTTPLPGTMKGGSAMSEVLQCMFCVHQPCPAQSFSVHLLKLWLLHFSTHFSIIFSKPRTRYPQKFTISILSSLESALNITHCKIKLL